jgi:ferredoxin-NADP reductase
MMVLGKVRKQRVVEKDWQHAKEQHGNENEASIIFKQQLETLEQQAAGKLKVHHILNQADDALEAIYKGIMTTEKVAALMNNFVKVTNHLT